MQIPKPRRTKSKRAIGDARKPYCEYCGKCGQISVHHVKSRGSGGGDTSDNLVSLGELCGCHTKAHNGQISKAELRAIIARR